VSRYAATTTNLLRWFKEYNWGKNYREQVRPFSFLLAYQTSLIALGKSRVEASIRLRQKDLDKATEHCFDRETGEPVPPERLKSYQEALAQYYLHPEAKFHNGDYWGHGVTP